jgi:DNA-binding response OmpR family regulator
MQSGFVLVVEDNNEIAYIVRYLLERERIRVELARDGRAAEKLMDSLHPPLLVILDVMLPYVDGFQLLERIRAHAKWGHIPVLMLTARSQEEDIVRALEAGANDYVTKPFKPNELLVRVKRLMKVAPA